MGKIWYGKAIDNNGYVYKRFVSVSHKEALILLRTIRERKGGYKVTDTTTQETFLRASIERIGDYLFLNNTQAEYIGVARNGYNTAIHIKR